MTTRIIYIKHLNVVFPFLSAMNSVSLALNLLMGISKTVIHVIITMVISELKIVPLIATTVHFFLALITSLIEKIKSISDVILIVQLVMNLEMTMITNVHHVLLIIIQLKEKNLIVFIKIQI